MLFGAAVVRGFLGALGLYLLIALTIAASYLILVYFFGKFEVVNFFVGGFVIFIVGGLWATNSENKRKRRITEMNERHCGERSVKYAAEQEAKRNRSKDKRKYLKSIYKQENS
jgi:Zn-dependent protease with chaperone function